MWIIVETFRIYLCHQKLQTFLNLNFFHKPCDLWTISIYSPGIRYPCVFSVYFRPICQTLLFLRFFLYGIVRRRVPIRLLSDRQYYSKVHKNTSKYHSASAFPPRRTRVSCLTRAFVLGIVYLEFYTVFTLSSLAFVCVITNFTISWDKPAGILICII